MSRLFANAQSARSWCRSPVRIAQLRYHSMNAIGRSERPCSRGTPATVSRGVRDPLRRWPPRGVGRRRCRRRNHLPHPPGPGRRSLHRRCRLLPPRRRLMIHRWCRLRIRRDRNRRLKSLALKPRILMTRILMTRNCRRRSTPTRDRRWCRPSFPNLGRQPVRRAAVALPSKGRRVRGARRRACCRVRRSVLPGSGRLGRTLLRLLPHSRWTTRCPGMGRPPRLSLKTFPTATEHHPLGLHRWETCSALIPGRPVVRLLGSEPPLGLPRRTPRLRFGMPAPRYWIPLILARAPPPNLASGTGRTKRPVSVSPEGSTAAGFGRSCNH